MLILNEMFQLQLTKNNHFKFGYNNQQFNFRSSQTDEWTIDYGSINRPVSNWKNECLLAAQEIKQSTNKNIFICLSGGIDSEVVAESFRLSQVPFTAAIMRFNDQLNSHDIEWAENYCEKFNIPIYYFDIDPIEFYNSDEFKLINESTSCFYPMLTLQMKLMKRIAELNGFPIVGSAECYLEKQSNNEWVMYEREIFASLYRFQIKNNFEGVCGFFQWSPEIIFSFLVDPMVDQLVQNKFSDINSTLEMKHEIYYQHFKIEKRTKYYGWENFVQFEKKIYQELIKKYLFCQSEVKTNYKNALQILNKL